MIRSLDGRPIAYRPVPVNWRCQALYCGHGVHLSSRRHTDPLIHWPSTSATICHSCFPTSEWGFWLPMISQPAGPRGTCQGSKFKAAEHSRTTDHGQSRS